MIVKILSFIASVLSNARYKAVLIPCIALVMSITGLTAVAIMHDSRSKTAANTTDKTDTDTNTAQPSVSPELRGADKQTPKDDSQTIAQNQNEDSLAVNESQPNNSPSSPTTTTTTSFDFTLNKSAVTVGRDGTSSMLTATSSDNSEISWSVTSDRNENSLVEVIAERNKDTGATYSFKLRAGANAAPGQYQFTVTATDAARNITLSKQIVLTVNS